MSRVRGSIGVPMQIERTTRQSSFDKQRHAISEDKTLTRKARRAKYEAVRQAERQRKKSKERHEEKHKEFVQLNIKVKQQEARAWFETQDGELKDLKRRDTKQIPVRKSESCVTRKRTPSPMAQLAKRRTKPKPVVIDTDEF